jgi:hypothetical protein
MTAPARRGVAIQMRAAGDSMEWGMPRMLSATSPIQPEPRATTTNTARRVVELAATMPLG